MTKAITKAYSDRQGSVPREVRRGWSAPGFPTVAFSHSLARHGSIFGVNQPLPEQRFKISGVSSRQTPGPCCMYLLKVETTDTGSVLQEFSASPGAAFPRLLLLLGSGERVTGCDSGLEVPAVTQRAVEIKIMRMRALTLARYGSS